MQERNEGNARIIQLSVRKFSIRAKNSISLNELLRTELPALLGVTMSNSKIRRLIMAGGVRCSGRQIRIPSYTVHAGNGVEVFYDEEKFFYEKKPDDINYELTDKDVLFEDDSVIVVNKPVHFPTEAGMVGERDNLHAAVVRFLFARQKIEKPNAKNPPYVGIMHRLDRDTSGVILFTKTRSVNAACHEMFENHTARKVYNAVVCIEKKRAGDFEEGKEFAVEFYMGRISPKGQPARWGRVKENDGGLFSRTEFKILGIFSEDEKYIYALAECRPLTGRTHQIRVHLSSLGIPILGDVLYGGAEHERIMLHAHSLTFPHPVTGKVCEFSIKPPFCN